VTRMLEVAQPLLHLIDVCSVRIAVTYAYFMARRVGAVSCFVMGAYLAAMGIGIGATMLSILLEGPWLGLEPEILIPIGLWLVAALLLWVGMKLWRQVAHD
jgi:hypothetical protein